MSSGSVVTEQVESNANTFLFQIHQISGHDSWLTELSEAAASDPLKSHALQSTVSIDGSTSILARLEPNGLSRWQAQILFAHL